MRVFRKVADVRVPYPKDPAACRDFLAVQHALRVQARRDAVRCSGLTQTYAECFFSNRADFTAVASTSAEASLIGGANQQPVIPALFVAGPAAYSKGFTLEASGVFSTTSTPTLTFQVRLGTTAGSAYLSGTSVGVTAAITTASGVTNKPWYLKLDLTCFTPGIGSTNATLSGAGYVMSPSFAAPYVYPLEPTTPDTATWTSTIDGGLTQYLNLSATWSASSASNTITCKNLRAFSWN